MYKFTTLYLKANDSQCAAIAPPSHHHCRALAIRQRTLGPEHPEVAQSLNNVGTALASQGKHAAAEQVGGVALKYAIGRKKWGGVQGRGEARTDVANGSGAGMGGVEWGGMG